MDDKMYVAHIPGDVEVEATFAIPSRPGPAVEVAEMPAVVVTEAHLEVSEAALPALHAETIKIVAESLGLPVGGVVEAVQKYMPAPLFLPIPALHAQTIQAMQEELRKPLSMPAYKGDKRVGVMEYSLTPRNPWSKPKIKRLFGQWVCFVHMDKTLRAHADTARAFCDRLNRGAGDVKREHIADAAQFLFAHGGRWLGRNSAQMSYALRCWTASRILADAEDIQEQSAWMVADRFRSLYVGKLL